jgi:DNA polymerase III gamma/tau subunit
MNSYLLISANKNRQLEKINLLIKQLTTGFPLIKKSATNNPDLKVIKPKNSIGIEQIRELQKFLSRKPYQYENQITIILNADKLTIQAQNALLKTLEEPPAHSLIFLTTNNKNKLLPTIISRCQIFNLVDHQKAKIKSKERKEVLKFLRKLLKASVGKRLQMIEPYTNSRENALNFLEKALFSLRDVMLHKQKTDQLAVATIIRKIHKAHTLINQNINTKLVLEELVIKL